MAKNVERSPRNKDKPCKTRVSLTLVRQRCRRRRTRTDRRGRLIQRRTSPRSAVRTRALSYAWALPRRRRRNVRRQLLSVEECGRPREVVCHPCWGGGHLVTHHAVTRHCDQQSATWQQNNIPQNRHYLNQLNHTLTQQVPLSFPFSSVRCQS